MLTDSVEFYLADYRAAGTTNDYVIKNWQYVNCISLGQVDSLTFEMKSSDNNAFGMKTPAFFSIDNFTMVSTVGVKELSTATNINLYPNPTTQNLFLNFEAIDEKELTITMIDVTGKEVEKQVSKTVTGKNELLLNTEKLESGIYFVEISDNITSKKIKFIKL